MEGGPLSDEILVREESVSACSGDGVGTLVSSRE